MIGSVRLLGAIESVRVLGAIGLAGFPVQLGRSGFFLQLGLSGLLVPQTFTHPPYFTSHKKVAGGSVINRAYHV